MARSWSEGRARPITFQGRPAVLGIIRDIGERKRAEAELKRSEERYRRLVEISPHGIRETDLNGTFTFSNPAHHQILGCADGEVVGKSFWALRRLGVGKGLAASTAGSSHGPWRISNSPALSYAMPNAFFARLGLASVEYRPVA